MLSQTEYPLKTRVLIGIVSTIYICLGIALLFVSLFGKETSKLIEITNILISFSLVSHAFVLFEKFCNCFSDQRGRGIYLTFNIITIFFSIVTIVFNCKNADSYTCFYSPDFLTMIIAVYLHYIVLLIICGICVKNKNRICKRNNDSKEVDDTTLIDYFYISTA